MKRIAGMLIILGMLILPVMAQEEAASAASPAGIGWLFLLVGIAAVFAIGAVMYRRDNEQPTPHDSSGVDNS